VWEASTYINFFLQLGVLLACIMIYINRIRLRKRRKIRIIARKSGSRSFIQIIVSSQSFKLVPFFALIISRGFFTPQSYLLQLIKVNRIFDSTVLVNLQHSWKSQGIISNVSRFIKASPH